MGVIVRKLIAMSVGLLLFASSTSGTTYGASPVMFKGQKTGQACTNKEVGRVVKLPNGSQLKCATSKGTLKPKWETLKKLPKNSLPSLPRAGLLPIFSNTYSGLSDGFSILILNFDSKYKWSCTILIGDCRIDEVGRLYGTNFGAGSTVALEVTTSRSGYYDASNNLRIAPKFLGVTPTMKQGTLKSLPNASEFQLDNFDPAYSWVVASTSGSASVDSSGVVHVTGLANGETTSVKITLSRSGYFDRSTTIEVQATIAFFSLTQREWQLVAKDPDAAKGQFVIVFGKITQFDAFTGLSSFRADVAGVDITSNGYWIGGDNSLLNGDSGMLKSFVTGDKFMAKVKVTGAYSYTSTANYLVNSVKLQIYEITRI
jgi:hypothetical protein